MGKDADVPFSAAAATGPEHPVEFKKRPFGILRYQPGQGGKGAMAMEVIPTSRYPGDPQGQAFTAGVKGGWVVKSIGGHNMLGEDFGKIMDLLTMRLPTLVSPNPPHLPWRSREDAWQSPWLRPSPSSSPRFLAMSTREPS